mgnify:CR=1 FL=1
MILFYVGGDFFENARFSLFQILTKKFGGLGFSKLMIEYLSRANDMTIADGLDANRIVVWTRDEPLGFLD